MTGGSRRCVSRGGGPVPSAPTALVGRRPGDLRGRYLPLPTAVGLVLSLVSDRPREVADPKPWTVNWWGWGMNPHPLSHKPRYPKELLEAGGIEPRTMDLQVLLRQTLTRLGHEGLASCLALLCSDEDLLHVVEVWSRLPVSRKRIILVQVNGLGAR